MAPPKLTNQLMRLATSGDAPSLAVVLPALERHLDRFNLGVLAGSVPPLPKPIAFWAEVHFTTSPYLIRHRQIDLAAQGRMLQLVAPMAAYRREHCVALVAGALLDVKALELVLGLVKGYHGEKGLRETVMVPNDWVRMACGGVDAVDVSLHPALCERLKMLVVAGVDLDRAGASRVPYLLECAAKGPRWHPVLRAMLEAGANFRVGDRDGCNVFHVATHPDTVNALIAFAKHRGVLGAMLAERDTAGRTPADALDRAGAAEIAYRLRVLDFAP